MYHSVRCLCMLSVDLRIEHLTMHHLLAVQVHTRTVGILNIHSAWQKVPHPVVLPKSNHNKHGSFQSLGLTKNVCNCAMYVSKLDTLHSNIATTDSAIIKPLNSHLKLGLVYWDVVIDIKMYTNLHIRTTECLSCNWSLLFCDRGLDHEPNTLKHTAKTVQFCDNYTISIKE